MENEVGNFLRIFAHFGIIIRSIVKKIHRAKELSSVVVNITSVLLGWVSSEDARVSDFSWLSVLVTIPAASMLKFCSLRGMI